MAAQVHRQLRMQARLKLVMLLLVAYVAAPALPRDVAESAQYIPLNERQTLVFLEAENFTVPSAAASTWQPREWAKSPNYFASTVANVFHSRRAYLHHPALNGAMAGAEATTAAAAFTVPAAGRYSVLIRYEAPFRFEIPFEVNITQPGHATAVFRRVYGRRSSPKVWGFSAGRHSGEYDCGPGLNTECAWPWGATENMVWQIESADRLEKGPAVIHFTPLRPDSLKGYCCWGDINIDAVMLSPNASDIAQRLNDSKTKDLPFDGMFSQRGEVFFQITNLNTTHALTVGVPLTYDHAIERGYRTHLNGTSFRIPFDITVAPGQKTGWLDVGGWMDTLDGGSWQISCDAFGPRPAAPNSTECAIQARESRPPTNLTLCRAWAERLVNQSACPGVCVERGKCELKWIEAACSPPPPPPTAQQLACYAVAEHRCAQNRSGGHAYAANYTECRQCMEAISPCPNQCAKGTRCQGAWFETGCHRLAPPVQPKPVHPLPRPLLGPAHCQIQVGVKQHPFDPTSDEVVAIDGGLFDSVTTGTEMVFDANTRGTKRMRHNADDFFDVMQQLKEQGPVAGRPPSIVPIYAATFPNGSDSGPSGTGPARDGYAAKQREFVASFCARNNSCLCDNPSGCDSPRETSGDQSLYLSAYVLASLHKGQTVIDEIAKIAAMPESVRHRITTVKLGDEIEIDGSNWLNDTSFEVWCRANKIELKQLRCDSWARCPYSPSLANASANAELYYWSVKAGHESGIALVKKVVGRLRPLLPKALLGANWAPGARYRDLSGKARVHSYIGWTFQWINAFRAGALSLPWSEDWIWQTPVGTQQMMALSIDAMRSGLLWSGQPDVPEQLRVSTGATGTYVRLPPPGKRASMLMYVMKHWPGNTNNSWTRQFYADLAHGVDRFDLFHLVPSTSGYTCDYVDADGGAYPTVRGALNALGSFEDIVAEGIVQPNGAAVALLYSESADIWYGSVGSYGAGLRSLYIAWRHAQVPVQIFTEDDCTAGRLFHADVLVVTVPNIADAAGKAIAEWVKAGGTVLATASGGLLNEYNQTNVHMQALLGVSQSGVWRGLQDSFNGTVDLIKQDLQFVSTLDTVTLTAPVAEELALSGSNLSMACKGAKSVFEVSSNAAASVIATFSDGSPAAIRTPVARGSSYYLGFLPGLSYFDPAIPLRPVDRGSTDENFNHFLPTAFSDVARALITLPLADRLKTNDSSVVPVRSTEPLVEVGLIKAAGIGYALPCINWVGKLLTEFTVTLQDDSIALRTASLASGGALAISEDKRSFTFALAATADVLVLRR